MNSFRSLFSKENEEATGKLLLLYLLLVKTKDNTEQGERGKTVAYGNFNLP